MAYFPYFRSQYDNRVDSFEIVILGKDSTVVEQEIQATGVLSYKDVDNTLEPIRGAQLDIEIDANIDKPFDLFLDFREKDFKITFFINNILIFEGFVSPEGVAQDYTSINWKAKITAFDNLGSLKNKEFVYNDELPSEFVFMDLCLKQTGLDLPIAFFDDINQNKKNGVVTEPYGAELNDGVRERIIEPEVFINDNDTFADCETILKDILQKYNAILVQQNIRYFDASNEEFSNQLCWLFCRIPLLKVPFTENIRPYKIRRINNFVNDTNINAIFQKEILTPNIVTIGTFSSPMKLLGTDGQTFLGQLDAIHKNKNQLIRQTRALQNFRFEQIWVELPDLLNYPFRSFNLIDSFFLQNDYINEVNGLLELQSTDLNNANFVVPSSVVALNINETVELQSIARTIEINGKGLITNNFGLSFPFNDKFLKASILHIVEDGDDAGVYIARGKDENGNNTGLLNDIELIKWELLSTDLNQAFVQPPLFTDFIQLFTTNESFNQSLNIDFKIELPPLIINGGRLNVFLDQFGNIDEGGNAGEKRYKLLIEDLNIKVIPPTQLGKGEYHDAKNLQDISTKIDDPVKVINADEDTNIFLNGLKRIVNEELVNYDFWTSYFSLDTDKPYLLKLTSIERIRLYSKSQNIFSGDIHGYLPYFSRLGNTAYNNAFSMSFTKWEYNTAANTISAEAMENDVRQPSVDYEKTIIFEDEDKKLID